MSGTALQNRVEQTLAETLELTAQRPNLLALHQTLLAAHGRLHQPMRVAIVGLIKAGKSTMMNALLGEEVVPTGTVEATFNVNWLRWGEERALLVHFKDGRPPEPRAYEELKELTLRAETPRDYLLGISYIEVRRPSSVLQRINLIDTPGLASHFVDDSQNTLDFLRLHGKELDRATETEARNADAVLYLFSRGIAGADEAVVEEFVGSLVGHATPLNAIGVLTKVDTYWSDSDEPMNIGREIAQRYTNHPKVRQLFYTIQPFCGLLAFGAQTLTDGEFANLLALAEVPEEKMTSRLRNVERFSTREYDYIPVPPAGRRDLLARLGQYGVWLACERIREGYKTRPQLMQELYRCSGAAELSSLVISHFGNRAYLIKLSSGLREIRDICFKERLRLSGEERAIVGDIAGRFEALEAQEHALQEFNVLRDMYQGRLRLTPDEARRLLTVMGEHGTSCARRLGLHQEPTYDSIGQLIPVAQEQLAYWQLRSRDSMRDRETLAAIGVITRSYEWLLYSIQEAQRHVAAARQYLAAP